MIDTTTPPKCPICENKLCVSGFNDIATTHPHLAGLLKDKSIATTRTIKNKCNEKHTFNCPECGQEVNTSFYLLNKYGLKCPFCSDGMVTFGRALRLEQMNACSNDFELLTGRKPLSVREIFQDLENHRIGSRTSIEA